MTKPSINKDLIKQINEGNVVLWWGWPKKERNVLVNILAEKSGYSSSIWDLMDAAGHFEHEAQLGRQALIQLLKDVLAATSDISPLAEILTLPIRQIITPRLDDQVEFALRAVRHSFKPVVDDIDIPYSDRPKHFLIKPYGSLKNRESLILTEQDYHNRRKQQPAMVSFMRTLLANQTWLFVNEDMTNRFLKDIFYETRYEVGRHQRTHYALSCAVDSPIIWQKLGITFLSDEISVFVAGVTNELAYMASLHQDIIRDVAPPERPYKFLDYFTDKDRHLFFGRNSEIRSLTEQIISSRFFVLFGRSGVGKTSILRAGVIPELEAMGVSCLYVRFSKDPEWAIKKELLQLWNSIEDSNPPDPNLVLPEYILETSNRLPGPLVIFIDQFEEFETQLSHITRRAFAKTVGELFLSDSNPVKLIFSIREDFLGVLDELRPTIFEPLAHTFRLTSLDREGARQAIEQPALAYDKQFEETAVEYVLDSLVENSETQEEVFPPHLQIVCYQIFEALPETTKSISRSFIEKRGGVETLLNEYLQASLATLDLLDQEPARNLLKQLVSSAGTKALKRQNEIVAVENPMDILDLLVERRLVRRIADDDGEYYELAHDQLVESIKSWINIEEQEAKDIFEMLTQEVNNRLYWKDKDESYIGIDLPKLTRVHEQRENPYLYLTSEMQNLLLNAALIYGYELGFWINRMEDVQETIEVVSQAAIDSDIDSRPLAGLSTRRGRSDSLKIEVIEGLTSRFKELLGNANRFTRIKAAYALWHFRSELTLIDFLKVVWVIIGIDFVRRSTRSAPKLVGVGISIVLLAFVALFSARTVCQMDLISADTWFCEWINPATSPITVEVPVEPTPIQPLEHEMVQIPAGTFIFGTKNESTEKNLDTYYIDKFEVTNAQYSRCVQAEICNPPVNSIFSFEEYQQHPAADISLKDAQEYCNWIGGYLPSELQWEKAARGTEGFEYPWGNKPLQEGHANICDAQCTEPLRVEAIDDGFPKTAPVGSFPSGASPFGVEDMVGNLWEWTSEGAARGGSWQNDRRSNKAISRVSFDPEARDPSLGFRCVRAIEP
jgi:formylglycine-generating enzyme required for sulfatase activity